MNYDSDLYPALSLQDEETYMNDYDNEEDFDDDVLDWDDEDAFTSAGMGVDESYGYAEDAFLDSFYEEQFECENDFGCDW
jgi:hypothetical protein